MASSSEFKFDVYDKPEDSTYNSSDTFSVPVSPDSDSWQKDKPIISRKRSASAMMSDEEESTVSEHPAGPITEADINGDGQAETPEEEEKRLKANEQERCRMQRFNSALNSLRNCIPDQFRLGSRRLSKIRTLRLAISYIAALRDILDKDRNGHIAGVVQQTTASPFYEFGAHGLNSSSLGHGHLVYENVEDTPSRVSLRGLVERGLSVPRSMLTPSGTPYQSPWNGRNSVGTPSDLSSDESFGTDQRLFGESPEHLAASAFLRGHFVPRFPSSSNETLTGFQDIPSIPFVNGYTGSPAFADINNYPAYLDNLSARQRADSKFD